MEIDDYLGHRLKVNPDGTLSVVLGTAFGAFIGARVIGVTGGGVFTYVPTVGMVSCWVRFWGTGGGGGGAVCPAGSTTLAQSGGSGGYAEGYFLASQIGASLDVTCGLRGAGGTAAGTNGTDGAVSTFGSLLTLPGGIGGLGDAVGGTTPGVLAGAIGVSIPLQGIAAIGGTSGRNSVRLSGTVAWSGEGGGSYFGGVGGRSAVANVAGADGFVGGGGSAGCSNGTGRAGGRGADAFCLVYEFK